MGYDSFQLEQAVPYISTLKENLTMYGDRVPQLCITPRLEVRDDGQTLLTGFRIDVTRGHDGRGMPGGQYLAGNLVNDLTAIVNQKQ